MHKYHKMAFGNPINRRRVVGFFSGLPHRTGSGRLCRCSPGIGPGFPHQQAFLGGWIRGYCGPLRSCRTARPFAQTFSNVGFALHGRVSRLAECFTVAGDQHGAVDHGRVDGQRISVDTYIVAFYK